MKATSFFILTCLSSTIFLIDACKEPFVMPPISGADKMLVVEGVFDSKDTTKIRLSRSADIVKYVQTKPESGAKVTIEAENGQIFSLTDHKNGLYTLPPVSAPATQKYRLKIVGADNKLYSSEFVPIRASPEIDNLSWHRDGEGVTIDVYTHDLVNNSRFYRWEWVETWKFATQYTAVLQWESKDLRDTRITDVDMNSYPYHNTCWRSENSTRIILESTARLSENVVSKKPLAFIANGSRKLGVHYSILVKQYTLSKEAFDYWENMRKISSDLGSMFSPQPSEIQGNIRCDSSPETPVVGFFEACNISSKRIFIHPSELSGWKYPQECLAINTLNDADSLSTLKGNYFPWRYANLNESRVYLVGRQCADCSLEGSPTKPVYWP